MLADAHLHLFSNGYPGPDGAPMLGTPREIDAYNALRATHGIEAGLVVGFEAGGIDAQNNSYLRALAVDNPWIHSVAYVEVTPAPTPERVEDLLDQGHVGLSIYLPDEESGRAVAAWPDAVWDVLGRARALVSLNARPEATEALKPTIERARGVAFTFAHLGLPGPGPAGLMPSAAKAHLKALLSMSAWPNVFVKISGLYAVREAVGIADHRSPEHTYVDVLLQSFGAEHCMWGSDFSPVLAHNSFEDALRIERISRLPAPEAEKVLGGTLRQLLQSRKA